MQEALVVRRETHVPDVDEIDPTGVRLDLRLRTHPAQDLVRIGQEGEHSGGRCGSSEKPAPSGTFEVRRVAYNPDYHYNPKFAWKGVKVKEPLTIKPGPNNPVGLVWIDLTAPSYGIHGTPEPDKIGKTESHGCIRLTNWDALDLAGMVHKGTAVRFVDRDSAAGPQAAK
jgi:lipoprotein-anchoring transpeptidase ErfK/SrfK